MPFDYHTKRRRRRETEILTHANLKRLRVCAVLLLRLLIPQSSLGRREIPKYSFTNYLGIEYLSISLSQVLNINCLLVSIERARENA